MSIKQLKLYFQKNFFDTKGRVKGVSPNKIYNTRKEFFDQIFSLEPKFKNAFDQKILKLKHIYFFLFENKSYNNMKCYFCDNLADVTSDGGIRKTCKEHRNKANELKKINSKEKVQERKIEYKNFLLNFKKFQKKMTQEDYFNLLKSKETIFSELKDYFNKNIVSTKTIYDTYKEHIKFFNALFLNFSFLAQDDLKYLHLKNFFDKKYILCEIDNFYLKEIKFGFMKTVCKQHLNEHEKHRVKKIKETMKKKYGGVGLQSEEIKEKYQKTLEEKYKQKHPMHIPEIREKFLSPNNSSQKHLKNLDKLNKEFIEKHFLNENREFKFQEFKNFYGYSFARPHQILKKLNIKYKKRSGTSSYEDEIISYIKSLNIKNIEKNSNKFITEIDIYIPEYKLGIEFDGLLWHSYGTPLFSEKELDLQFQKFRHVKKTETAESKGIHLLHIFENEWENPVTREIWKSVIAYKLGKIKTKYFARKLQIREVDSKEASQFFEENHLQGNSNAKIKLGLYQDDKLISCMTFSKPRYTKHAEYELIRFASVKFSACVGCAQKLFKYFIENYNPKSIVSYANRRWAFKNKNIYQTLGFKYIGKSEPNYFYFKLNERPTRLYPRVTFQKHKLKKLETTKDFYDDNLTETQIMIKAGYRRIYDCGNLVYIWSK